MFGLGWTELLVIGVVALVVIGPKDLPVVMNRMGKAVSAIRRMGGEFQREINKASGLDTITDLRKSITEPLKQTATEIRKEFNKPLAGGGVEPSGAIKPKDPKVESVVDEIHEKVGMTPPAATTTGPAPQPYTPFTKEAQDKYRKDQMAEAVTSAAKKSAVPNVESPAPPEATVPPVEKPRAPLKARPPLKAKVTAPAEPAPVVEVVASTPKPRKPRAAKPKSDA